MDSFSFEAALEEAFRSEWGIGKDPACNDFSPASPSEKVNTKPFSLQQHLPLVSNLSKQLMSDPGFVAAVRELHTLQPSDLERLIPAAMRVVNQGPDEILRMPPPLSDLDPKSGPALIPFVYDPIDRSKIRLLKVNSRHGEGTTFHLSTFDFHRAPPYYAISYVWGDQSDTTPIVLDGHLFPVRRNLYNLLSNLGPSLFSNDVFFWIDAIAIDQSNEIEKSGQLRNMGDIYHNAAKVIAYLGEPANKLDSTETEMVISRIQAIVAFLRDLVPPNGLASNQKRIMDYYANPLESHQYMIPDPLDPPWTLLWEIFESDWWTRAWIVQEVYRGHDILVVFGGISIPLESIIHIQPHMQNMFAKMLAFILQHRLQAFKVFHANTVILASKGAHRHRADFFDPSAEISGLPLLRALDMVSQQECFYGQDRIYAALGIAPKDAGKDIIPNYVTDLDDICIDIAQVFLRGDDPLHLLDFLGVVPAARSSFKSWLPNWTIKHGHFRIQSQFGYNRHGQMTIPANYHAQLPSIIDGNMHVFGWDIAVVEIVDPEDAITASNWAEYEEKVGQFQLQDIVPQTNTRTIKQGFNSQPIGQLLEQLRPGDMSSRLYSDYWQVAKSSLGLAIVPKESLPGDHICSFIGGCVFFILRDHPTSTSENLLYEFVGESYVFGQMDNLFSSKASPSRFVLI